MSLEQRPGGLVGEKVVAAGRGPGRAQRRVCVRALAVRRRAPRLPAAVVPVVGENCEQPQAARARRGDDVVEAVEEVRVVGPRRGLQPGRVEHREREEAHEGEAGGGGGVELRVDRRAAAAALARGRLHQHERVVSRDARDGEALGVDELRPGDADECRRRRRRRGRGLG